MDNHKAPLRVPFPGWRAFQQDFGARLYPDAASMERAPFSVTPLAFAAARAAEGSDFGALVLGETCGACGCVYHPACERCFGRVA